MDSHNRPAGSTGLASSPGRLRRSSERQISANSQAWCVVGVSPLVRRPTFPPVVGRFLNKNTRRDLRRYVVAELPQLLRCAGVLIEHLVDTEGVQFAGAKAIDSFADMCNEDGQLRLVIGRHNAACSPSLRLARHDLRIAGDGGGHGSRRASATWALWTCA